MFTLLKMNGARTAVAAETGGLPLAWIGESRDGKL